MIFSPEMVRRIKEGGKSVTRRPTKGKSECRYRQGGLYAVQPGRGMPGELEITITAVSAPTPLGYLSSHEAKREGFSTPTEFADYWRTLYGSYDARTPVFVIAFKVGDYRDLPRLLAKRLGTRHGDYVDVPYLAASDAGEALTAEELEAYTAQARARDLERRPPRTERDRQRDRQRERRRKKHILAAGILSAPASAASVNDPIAGRWTVLTGA